MSRKSNKQVASNETAVVEKVLPPNAIELMQGTTDILTEGKLYAISDPTKFSDDPQSILTEDMFRASVPEGYYVVRAVGPRHFVPEHYDTTRELEPGEYTGLMPDFSSPEDEMEENPNRKRMREAYAAEGGGQNGLLKSRSALLRRTNKVVAAATTPGVVQQPALDDPPVDSAPDAGSGVNSIVPDSL